MTVQKIKDSIAKSGLFQRTVVQTRLGSILLVHLGRFWPARYRDVIASSDNAFIPRVTHAGEFVDGCQILHNGIRIAPGSYYGYPMTRMLKLNQGVHEPQEERAFSEVLKHLPAGATMLELGAFWAFYSMWFYKTVADARCFMVEPAAQNLAFGKKNFELNGIAGDFTQAYVGTTSGVESDGVKRICVDDFVANHKIDFLHMLHSDIQGFEADMLRGAERTFAEKKVGYVFISTHSNELHQECIEILKRYGHSILADCDLDDTYSSDGLIISKAPSTPGPTSLEISKKRGSKN